MSEEPASQVTDEEDIDAARVAVRRGVHGLVGALLGILTITGIAAGAITSALVADAGIEVTALAVGAACLVVGGPFILILSAVTQRRGLGIALETVVQKRVMESEARRREFETRLVRALEMADDEVAAYETVRRAFALAVPDTPVELLLADNSHAHLDHVVTVAHSDAHSRCPVTSPDQCVAARRAQTQVFPDSEALDSCPLLRERGSGSFSAVCIPVSIMGRTVGAVHATGAVDAPMDEEHVKALQVLANQAGNRLGMLRIMADTQLQASTDGLTGLVNRRSLENHARALRAKGEEFALVMADLDQFKTLNDTHGHETGDRALRVFAETLRDSLRAEDMACRYGGEEFVVLLPGLDTRDATEVMERVREALARTTRRGDVPSFTASFGVAHTNEADDLDDLLARADRALFAAKDAGRDRICIDGGTLDGTPNLTAIS
jgi:diguanylate cyclase (GGDEF)-like protein